jgi:hypothetical protein
MSDTHTPENLVHTAVVRRPAGRSLIDPQLAAPLIILDQPDCPDQEEIVVMLADFSFTPPDQIFAELKKSGSKASPAAQVGAPSIAKRGSMAGMVTPRAAAKPDLNDVKYDAFLAARSPIPR